MESGYAVEIRIILSTDKEVAEKRAAELNDILYGNLVHPVEQIVESEVYSF